MKSSFNLVKLFSQKLASPVPAVLAIWALPLYERNWIQRYFKNNGKLFFSRYSLMEYTNLSHGTIIFIRRNEKKYKRRRIKLTATPRLTSSLYMISMGTLNRNESWHPLSQKLAGVMTVQKSFVVLEGGIFSRIAIPFFNWKIRDCKTLKTRYLASEFSPKKWLTRYSK